MGRAAPGRKRLHTTKESRKQIPLPNRCALPCCWKTALGVRCTCAPNLKGRCAKQQQQKQKPTKRPKRTRKRGPEEKLVPGISDSLYPGQSVRSGPLSQFMRAYNGPLIEVTTPSPTRKTTQGATPVTRQKRARRPPMRYR